MLAKDVLLSNLAILLIQMRSFQWFRRIFSNLSMSKVEKTVKRSILEKKEKTSSGYKLGLKRTTLAVPRIFSKKIIFHDVSVKNG